MSSKRLVPLVAVTLLLPAVAVWAAPDEPQDTAAEAAAEAAQDAPSADEIAGWIKQLDADEFSEREAASAKLAAAGKTATAALAEAATSDSLEVSSRSMKILRQLFESSDAQTKAAAKEALEKIAKANHPSASPRAQEAIRPKPQTPAWQLPGAITISTTISRKNVNGVKEISVKTDGKKIKINEDPKQGIKVEITETHNGKQVTKITEAKNAEELKKKDQKAYQIYQQYAGGNAAGGAIQVQIQAGGGGIQAIPIQPRIQIRPAVPGNVPILPGRARIESAKRIELATKQLQRIGEQLKRYTKDAEKTEELQKALKEFQQELKRQLAEVEKQLKQQPQQPENIADDAKQPADEAEPEENN